MSEMTVFEFLRLPSCIIEDPYVGFRFCPNEMKHHEGEDVAYFMEVINIDRNSMCETQMRRIEIVQCRDM